MCKLGAQARGMELESISAETAAMGGTDKWRGMGGTGELWEVKKSQSPAQL